MNDRKPYPGFWQSVLLLVIIVVIQLIIVTPILIINFIMKVDLITHPATLGFINLISIGIVILIGKKVSKISYRELFPLNKINGIQLLTVIITSLGFSIALSDLDNLVRILIPMPAKRILEYRDKRGSFKSIEELLNIKGIGEKTLENIKPYLKL